ncbi:hypothetical protein RND81_11G032400 [Saponaria officinalis]|uniref:Retrovirus-related Pol polyprotein from transposon TNT 1-94-like beta-barrel domain-containing protein n=1 Tax=Saponaria officinalis TaxID=3572 RepID=A0AAW1HHE7_SAPOF
MINTHSQTNHSKEWIVDSGATNHMTAHLDMLDNVKLEKSRPKINLPDGSFVRVSHKGNVTLENGLKLKDVLYIPEFKQNLLSVNKLIRDNNFYVTFFDENCYVQECFNGRVRDVGNADNGLYHIRTVKRAPKVSNYVNRNSINTKDVYSADCKFEENDENCSKAVIKILA